MNLDKYKNIPSRTRKKCVVCGSAIVNPVIELPKFPITEIYVDHLFKDNIGCIDQAFHLCEMCGHGQVVNVIDAEVQYGNSSDYFNRTSKSATGRLSSDVFVKYFNEYTGGAVFDTIIELGCNDLHLLNSIGNKARQLIGIDPVMKKIESREAADNIRAVGDFFENVNLGCQYDVVICKDTLEHVSEPMSFVKKVVEGATPKTLFFFQFPLLETLLMNCRFDQVFHQHLNYFSMKSIMHMLTQLGCSLLDWSIDYDHWGQILVVFKKGLDNLQKMPDIWNIRPSDVIDRYKSFRIDMEQTSRRLNYYKGELMYGYGAALMLPVLCYHLNSDLDCLGCIIDDDINKDGMYYFNISPAVRHSSKITNLKNAIVVVTAPFSKISVKSILTSLFQINPRQIIVPFRNM